MKNSVRRRVFGLFLGVLMLTVSLLSLSTASQAQIGIGISVRIGPPALPVYAPLFAPILSLAVVDPVASSSGQYAISRPAYVLKRYGV